jgi:molybdopterin molybdotransferase
VDPGGWVGVGTVGEDDIPLIIVDSTVLGAYVAFEVFVRPVLRALAGHRELFRPVVRARTSAAGQSLAGVRSFLPATLTLSDGGFAAEPYPPRAGAAPFWLHEPNALMIIPERLTSVSAGDEVALIRLDRQ